MCYERFKKNINFLKNKLIKRMFAIISMFIICFGSNVTVFAESNSSDNLLSNKDDLKVFMDNTFQKKMKEEHVPGAVITVVKDGKVIFSKGYGYADLENKVPVTPDKTLVRIASVSKLFTYTAMMQLSEQGKVDLKADVNKYLKGYTLKNKYSNPVTVEELLTHTSGIDDNRIADLSKDKRDLLPMNDFLKKHLPKVVREPGTVINYSSYDAALAGGIVERVSGKPLNNFIEDNIFKPLKMSNSTLNRDMNPKGLECGYNYENDKIVKAELLKGYFNNYAVGGIISTSEDMAKFMIAQLNNGAYRDKRILQESTAIDMHSQHATFDKRLPGMAYGFNEKYVKGYRAIEHPGYSPDNIYSGMTLFPDENLGVFISINQGMNNLPDEIVSEMVAKYFPKKEEAKNKKPYYTSKSNLKDFIGTYRFSENPVSTFHKGDAFPEGEDVTVSLKDGKALTLTGKDVFVGNKYSTTLKEIEPLVFKRADTGEYVIFKKNKAGKIYYLAQQQDSWHGTYEKLNWYELSDVQIGVTLFSLIIFLIVVIFSIGRIIYNTIKKKNGETNPLKKTNFYMTFVISLLNITFFIAALFVLGEPTRYGISVGAKLLLCVPILSLILNLLFLVFIVMDWMKKNSKLQTRLYYFIVDLTGILYMWFLNYWNLFGFKY
ncbi:serine hydrolase domain-containing protein [Clostridium coskatii]|uniref:Penicillin-binding protein PbpX n=1 Tax=Clostridium coskatii TaxID=1705578 RepID=A0A166UNP6_9CLOT|nr:serine hydrolase domain-containing protein [Clostridium coskatii]OAA95096.1 putative penicillin-binding protein PbpX [Clostridium coskatii]OBR97556.1 putative penicillin-binding protein PbpX [Clostridium coskatii]